jgi:hypothetical protein
MLGRQTPVINTVQKTVQTAAEKTERFPREKFPQDYSDGSVVLVKNYYRDKSDTLFGDFKNLYSRFREEHLTKERYIPSSRFFLVMDSS